MWHLTTAVCVDKCDVANPRLTSDVFFMFMMQFVSEDSKHGSQLESLVRVKCRIMCNLCDR